MIGCVAPHWEGIALTTSKAERPSRHISRGERHSLLALYCSVSSSLLTVCGIEGPEDRETLERYFGRFCERVQIVCPGLKVHVEYPVFHEAGLRPTMGHTAGIGR